MAVAGKLPLILVATLALGAGSALTAKNPAGQASPSAGQEPSAQHPKAPLRVRVSQGAEQAVTLAMIVSKVQPQGRQEARQRHVQGEVLDTGTVGAGLYSNAGFGFACKIPVGWVLRTEDMNSRDDDGANPNSAQTSADSGKAGHVLLAAFSRPPEARAEDVNSSILIAAESVTAYPGLKEAAQYFGPVSEVAKAQGFKVVNEPYDASVGTKTLVRGDFQKDIGSRVMRQSTLVMLARGYAVSFTFVGGTEDELEELVRQLSFGATAKSGK
jgi:hypothetical protein